MQISLFKKLTLVVVGRVFSWNRAGVSASCREKKKVCHLLDHRLCSVLSHSLSRREVSQRKKEYSGGGFIEILPRWMVCVLTRRRKAGRGKGKRGWVFFLARGPFPWDVWTGLQWRRRRVWSRKQTHQGIRLVLNRKTKCAREIFSFYNVTILFPFFSTTFPLALL